MTRVPPKAVAAPPDHMQLVRNGASGIEAIRACFSGHACDLHRHDDWLVGVTECGQQDFFCRGSRRRSTAGRVILIEPQEAHDGQAGNGSGFAYSMLYLPRSWLHTALADPPVGDPGFLSTLVDDPKLATAIRAACLALASPTERLTPTRRSTRSSAC
jgi:AraC-like ligand binding domain